MPFRKIHPSANFFSSHAYLDYLAASDAGFPSLDLFIAKVASQIKTPAVWDGLVPGFAFMPLHQPEGGFDAYLQQEIRGPDSTVWKAARNLFRREVADTMYEGFRNDLRAEIERLPHGMHGLARFVIENRSRNRAAMNPLKVYANHTRAFTPGLSKDFMAHAAMIPFDEKQGAGFCRSLLAKLDPHALAVPFLSGGSLMRGDRYDRVWCMERLQAGYRVFRSRHPRLFGRAQYQRLLCWSFLRKYLLEGADRWLNPDLRGTLRPVQKDNYLAWKLLFHWKASQWIPASGKFSGRIAPRAQRAPERCYGRWGRNPARYEARGPMRSLGPTYGATEPTERYLQGAFAWRACTTLSWYGCV